MRELFTFCEQNVYDLSIDLIQSIRTGHRFNTMVSVLSRESLCGVYRFNGGLDSRQRLLSYIHSCPYIVRRSGFFCFSDRPYCPFTVNDVKLS